MKTLVQRLREHGISRYHGGCADCYSIVMDDAADALESIVRILHSCVIQRAPSDDKIIAENITRALNIARGIKEPVY